ncbi:hypothetical protein KBY55_00820 [Streptomyces sp. b94]|uniref:hypothetical protein n=1 Tax=Streptomyces sp. b94 TaxID=1827634 RepID=UPI001B378DCF|nr:hypothetical protein [Streptomyces sp. b94]MBQ1094678.1 hypothetical protein [Streptomyces sp. b94]
MDGTGGRGGGGVTRPGGRPFPGPDFTSVAEPCSGESKIATEILQPLLVSNDRTDKEGRVLRG